MDHGGVRERKMEKVLVLVHLDETGSALPKVALEAVGQGIELAGAELTIGIIGDNVQLAADSLAGAGARLLAVSGSDFSQARYVTDAAACEALCRKAEATIVLAPATSRFNRVLPGVAHRLGGAAETHVTGVAAGPQVTRWFYRQRIEGTLARTTRPWVLLLESGTHSAFPLPPNEARSGAPAPIEQVAVALPAVRTNVVGVKSPKLDEQTIRPDAKLLFVAGAGWTKKQADGQTHVADAEVLIKGFLRESGASLGSSKSLVDQSSENQAVLTFLTHLNQVGQTGATPRHPKGLSTCCHGEEPHVVGWRFINERRAINLDANCGWARGKADVLYVADAFKVMEKLNALIAERQAVGVGG